MGRQNAAVAGRRRGHFPREIPPHALVEYFPRKLTTSMKQPAPSDATMTTSPERGLDGMEPSPLHAGVVDFRQAIPVLGRPVLLRKQACAESFRKAEDPVGSRPERAICFSRGLSCRPDT